MSETKNNHNNNGMLIKIRSKYIVMKIFDNLKDIKLLELLRYNKKYQKLMNKKLNDYKNVFSKIEIEIILKENEFGKFINIENKNMNSSIHVYLNDNKEETKRKRKITFLDYMNNITKIKIVLDNKIKSLSKFFYDCPCIKKINFTKFYKYDINDMSYMFYGCSSLEEINFMNFNADNVTNMNHMFYDCSSLKKLNLSNININNLKDMSGMFSR